MIKHLNGDRQCPRQILPIPSHSATNVENRRYNVLVRHTLTVLALFTGCALEDIDQDGVPRGEDCNDTDPSQGRPIPLHIDGDRDGFGGPGQQLGCPGNAWLVDRHLDCNDDDPAVHPEAPEIPCDGRDNDCDASTVDGPASTDGITWPTVQQAVDAARFGAVVRLCPSRITETIRVDRDVEIHGAGPERTVIDGAGSGSTVHLGALATLRGLTVTGGDAAAGGGVYIEPDVPGPVTLRDLVIRDNHATQGGGVWTSGTTVVIVDAIISGNHATAGGGVWADSDRGVEIRMERTSIVSNQADQGGGLRVRGALFADDVGIQGNRATVGGGVWFDGSLASGSSSLAISENTAEEGGGAAGLGDMVGVQFRRNTANHGGGIATQGVLSLADTTITANLAAVGDGGGLLAEHPVTLTRGTLSSNEAAANGGAVSSRASLVTSGTTFQENRATEGGAVWASGMTRLDATHFVDNVATVHGGAVSAACSQARLDLVGGTFETNRASLGAALWIGGRMATITGTRLVDNTTSESQGGAVQLARDACEASSVEVGSGTTWTDNSHYDIAAGTRGYAAPNQPFSCAIAEGGTSCPVPLP